jgi:hypothetical protein
MAELDRLVSERVLALVGEREVAERRMAARMRRKGSPYAYLPASAAMFWNRTALWLENGFTLSEDQEFAVSTLRGPIEKTILKGGER